MSIFNLRVLYLRNSNILLSMGEERFARSSKLFICLICLALTLSHIVENLFIDPSLMAFFSYFKYFNARFHRLEAISDYIFTFACAVCNLFELVLFIMIGYEMFKFHQNRVRLNMAETHVRKNAVTATGHFLSWLLEAIGLGFIMVLHVFSIANEDFGLASWVVLMLCPSYMFCVLPTVQIISSPELRHFFHDSLCVRMPCQCNQEAITEEIEMTMANNNNNNVTQPSP